MISAPMMPDFYDDDFRHSVGCVEVPNRKMLKGLKDSLRRSRYGKQKWQKVRLIADAQITERGDIVMIHCGDERSENEVAFVKYRENLGATANVFVQAVCGVRLNGGPDYDLETMREIGKVVVDRITEVHGVVGASGGVSVSVTVNGPRVLTDMLVPVVNSGLMILSGVPIHLNGEVVNAIEERFEEERSMRGYEVSGGTMPLGVLFGWLMPTEEEFDQMESHRPKLRIASADDWAWAFDEPDEMSGQPGYEVAAGSDPRLADRLMKVDLGDRASLAVEKFITVHKAVNMMLAGAWKEGGPLELLFSLGISAQFNETSDEVWEIGVCFEPRYFPVSRNPDLTDAARALSAAIRKQVLLHLVALAQSCLLHTKNVFFDVMCAFPGKESKEIEIGLQAIRDGIDDLEFHTDDDVQVDTQIILAFDEDAIRDGLESSGLIPSSRSRKKDVEHHEDEEEAAARIARRIRQNLSVPKSEKASLLGSALI